MACCALIVLGGIPGIRSGALSPTPSRQILWRRMAIPPTASMIRHHLLRSSPSSHAVVPSTSFPLSGLFVIVMSSPALRPAFTTPSRQPAGAGFGAFNVVSWLCWLRPARP